ncbi:VOC family protein [Aquirufa nivalisilvae]|uniref:VOC family protein n=1 Tax=Aquirufa nivalisilvae TaxID=2516557 RepID=UPI001032994D|nr:glyoxalase/bleomycin resistance/extradiol dioxygenase family protein [Aquirufa nivalisilvae]TBH73430.1 glyoxalase/bleomycin resistance/extradiol dioxygenase family protein [Aquirufa nivalisilvae]
MKQIFINLPVRDVQKSMNFYAQLGFSNKTLFSDDEQKCMVWSEQIYVMLMSNDLFQKYSKKSIPDIKQQVAASFSLPVKSLNQVHEMIDAGLKAGGTEPFPMIDEGFMQVRKIVDLDGHTWDFMYLDMTKFENQKINLED